MKAIFAANGYFLGSCEEDPKIPMGTVVEIQDRYFWIFSGCVNHSENLITYQGHALGSLKDIPKIEVKF